MTRYIFIIVLGMLITFIFGDYIGNLTGSDYEKVLAALLNISSIVFAIVGAWIAIIYPKSMSNLVGIQALSPEKEKEVADDNSYLSELVEIVLVSAIILMAVLSIYFLQPLLVRVQWVIDSSWIDDASFFGVGLLVLVQLNAVFRVVVSNYFFLVTLKRSENKEKLRKRAKRPIWRR